MTKNKITAIILAGGTGKRMSSKEPKQFLKIGKKAIIVYSVRSFSEHPQVDNIVIVANKNHMAALKNIIKKENIKKPLAIIQGGSTRQRSALCGIKSCKGSEYVLIHDAARPFVSRKIITKALKAAFKTGASMPVIDVEDTIVEGRGKYAVNIPDRNKLKKIQTPQAFKYKMIADAHEKAVKKGLKNATDDCSLIMRMGKPVELVDGDVKNLKITTKTDFLLAKQLIKYK